MATKIKDVTLKPDAPSTLLLSKHVDFIKEYGRSQHTYEYGMTDYLRVSGMYWGLTALELMDRLHDLPENEVVEYIAQCQDKKSGGISGSLGHDPHLLHTLSAIQVSGM